jgi:dTDP-4-amino-4,6-dideoxygalactose transaminase
MTAFDVGTAGRIDASPIGGFFETHARDDAAAGRSVLEAWTDGRPYAAFVNARSAFASLVAAHPQAAVWLPAFLCHDLAQAADATRIRFYPVREGFEPDLDRVEAEAAAGDLVLVCAYFGLPVSDRARLAFARRADLRVVEDRAQALDPGPGVAGAWRLYSPRKLMGVADGGLLVAPSARATPAQPTGRADAAALWAAPRLRAQDPLGRNNAAWHAANQAKEAAMAVTQAAMTVKSRGILAATPLDGLAAARLRNWRALDARLRPWSALPTDIGAPPLGYVLRLQPDRRDAVLAGLHAERIFAAVHWPRIAAPEAEFPREAQWTRELITLPCDHRYGPGEMARVAGCVMALLA